MNGVTHPEKSALLELFRPDDAKTTVCVGDAIDSARRALRKELQTALMEDPQREVWTPGGGDLIGGRNYTPAVRILFDSFGDEREHEVARLLADAAKGDDVQVRAALLLSTVDAEHAKFHAEDAARQEAQQ